MLSDKPFEVPPYLLDRIEGMERVRMAIAGANHPIALESARQGADAGLIDPVLVGDADIIRAAAREMDWDVTDFTIVDAVGAPSEHWDPVDEAKASKRSLGRRSTAVHESNCRTRLTD